MPRFRFQALLAAAVLGGCADPFPPLPPPEEILVVANRTDGSLSLIPVGAPTSGTTLTLGVADVEAVAALDHRLLALSPSVAVLSVIDLQAPRVTGTIQLPSGSRPSRCRIPGFRRRCS